MRYVSIAFVFACVLCLAGCGDDEDSGGGSLFDPGAMQDYAKDMEKLGKEMESGTIELTDELMEEYVKIATELESVSKEGEAGSLKILNKYGWNWVRWASVSAKVHAGMAQTMSQSSRPKLEEAVERLNNQIKNAKDNPEAAAALKGLEMQRDNLQKSLENMPVVDSVMAKNQAVLERWRAKIEAIGK